MIKHRITMALTSADLYRMAERARQIEQKALVGHSLVIHEDWDCGSNVHVHIILDYERAARSGLVSLPAPLKPSKEK